MGLFDEVPVEGAAARLNQMWDQLAQENERAIEYRNAADFWDSFQKQLTERQLSYGRQRNILQFDTKWTGAAADAFYARAQMGIDSVGSWLTNANLPDVIAKFRAAADEIGPAFQRVDELRDILSGKGPAIEGYIPPYRIVGDDVLVSLPASADLVNGMIDEARTRADGVAAKLADVKIALDSAKNGVQNRRWEGPRKAPAPSPTPVGPGGGPSAPGGGPSSTAPGGPAPGGPGGGPPAGGPEAPAGGPEAPGGPAAMDATEAGPGGPGSEPPTTPESTSDTGFDQPGMDQLGGPDTALDPSTQLPPTDPALAGMPTATLDPTTTPTTSLPPSTVPGGLTTPTGSDLGRSPTTVPFTPAAATPFQSTRQGGEPAPRNSTVDGGRNATPTGGGGNQGAGPSPVPRGGTAGAGPGATTGPAGFYPPMVPPMGAGLGGNGSGVRPGDADFAGGPVRKVGGRDSWRAGLRPQLLGRAAADHDEEPPYEAPSVPSAGDVLDEELWQVPGAAPATPPDPPQRRGRAW